jgi:glycosyltransferase involved in cell wall biosynthesis
MKVSIITVVYNNVSTLNDTIHSVLTQTYSDIEYIIIDGGSKDGSVDIIRQYESKIFKWISEPDKGMYDALNKGISFATGDVIGIVHSDDMFDNANIIEEIVGAFKISGCDAVYGDLVYVNKENPTQVIRNWKSQPFTPQLLKKGWMPAHPTFFVLRKWYQEFGGFNISYKVAADYELMVRFLKSGKLKCYYLPKNITRMRVGGKSNKSIKNIIQKSYDDYKTIRLHKIGGIVTLLRKNLSKIPQFFAKK